MKKNLFLVLESASKEKTKNRIIASIFGLITIILVCIFYRERLSVPQLLGVGLVFLSIGILSLG